MNPSDRLSLKHKSNQTTFAHSMCLSLVLAVISLCASQTAMAQTSYSDMWLDNAPSAVQSADGSIEPPVDEIESDQGNLAGCGVTEDDYTSYHLYETQTKIKSPSGIITMGFGDLDSWSRADVSFPLDLETAEEGSYMIETKHTEYPYDYEYQSPSYSIISPTAPQANLFSWITRLFGGVHTFKIVYKYSSTLAVSGLESLYFYNLVCQRPYCQADLVKSYSSKKWAVHPPYVVIKGVKLSVNLLFTTVHACVGKSTQSFFPQIC
jgi:hypothetical protein